MHLLVVAVSFPSPGNPYPGSFIGQQVRALAEHVERITVLCPIPWVPPFGSWIRRYAAKALFPHRYSIVDDRCEVLFPRYLKAPGNIFLWWTKIQWCRLVNQTVARFSDTCPVSIIHAHGGSVSAWAALRAARRHKIPCVVTYHGSEVHTIFARRQKGWKLCRDAFRHADLNLPVSRLLMKILADSVSPTGRCKTMLLGVDRSIFFPAVTLMIEPQVVFVGRVEEAKGVYDLLQAWKKVIAQCPTARLVMVGEDRTRGLFLNRARCLGIHESITLTGQLSEHQVASLMRESRIFCLPSHNEGTPVSAMEALSCGLPVVVTRVGGIPDIVENETTGVLIEKGDVDRLASALLMLLRDYSMCICLGRKAQGFAATHLDIRRTVSRLADLYQETLSIYSPSRKSVVGDADDTSVSAPISDSISNGLGVR